MSPEPVVIHENEREWETWRADQLAERGRVWWKTLISGGLTRSSGLTLGVARLPPGALLRRHRHEQAEVYFVLEGSGIVTIDGEAHPVGPGSGVFLAGDAVHALECTGASDLRVAYVLAADSFEDVMYMFDH
jgi:quercetin dioxygenase-like cupin family protein